MRFKLRLLVCLCCLTGVSYGQDSLRNAMVGPFGDQTRIVIALTDPTPDGYRLQSMIIDMTPLKKAGAEPSEVHLDLTSTVRSLSTGAQQQKILILRWKKSGDIEVKCDGEWKKQESSESLQNVMANTKTVIQRVPQGSKSPTNFDLSSDLEQTILALFESLNVKAYPCLRHLSQAGQTKNLWDSRTLKIAPVDHVRIRREYAHDS